MRLIDADKLKRTEGTFQYQINDSFDRLSVSAYRFEDVENAPTVDAIPVEWLKNKRDELEKEYHDLFHAYTDEGMNDQVRVLNDLHAFRTVLRYWEKENE